MSIPALPIVLRCDPAATRKARYALDTLLVAAGIPVDYVDAPPESGPWLLYAAQPDVAPAAARCLHVRYDAHAWRCFAGTAPADRATARNGLPLIFAGDTADDPASISIGFDLAANAFYFLSSWAERCGNTTSRRLYSTSEFAQLDIPRDIVDRYLAHLTGRLNQLAARLGVPAWRAPDWPGGNSFAVVLSHDVDFLPVHVMDNFVQGAKTVLRHLVRQRDPEDAWRAARGWLSAVVHGRDPYGCVPEIIARERALGVRSSFQVAVGHRHPNDVNYRIEDDRVRDYLRAITDAGFDLCLHGSYRSTENAQWYLDEVELLARRLARPFGSRQHFLSFDYDGLFAAQETAGIRYDMSMGFPDCPGPRAGFSYPYFPYNLREDRPYRVLQISLFLMDVTLRSYMSLRPDKAQRIIEQSLMDLRAKRGCASVVWHPIVFGGARDPGYDALYFGLIEHVQGNNGLATDGRGIDSYWRDRAGQYPSFG